MVVIRNGKMIGTENFRVDRPFEVGEFEQFIAHFYERNGIAINKVLIENFESVDKDGGDNINQNESGGENVTSLSEFLSKLAGKKVEVLTPQKGTNLKLIKTAKQNAKEDLEKNVLDYARKERLTTGACLELKELLNLNEIPTRIECYDISHTSGTLTTASMVVFINGEANKNLYRKFRVKTVVGIDDFASHEEVFLRRLLELKKGQDLSFKERPNLVIIDGGKGQLSSALLSLDKMREEEFKDVDNEESNSLNGTKRSLFNFQIISLAKREEEVFVPHRSEPIILDKSTYALRLIQRLRDESHRFAITFHKSLRDKKMLEVVKANKK
jgi:excinuclease ABC subunit C